MNNERGKLALQCGWTVIILFAALLVGTLVALVSRTPFN